MFLFVMYTLVDKESMMIIQHNKQIFEILLQEKKMSKTNKEYS